MSAEPTNITEPNTDNTRLQEAEAVIKNYMLWTGAAGVIPMPIVDTAAITAFQLAMLNKIGNIYNQQFTANWGKSVIGSLTGGLVSTSIGKGIGRNLLKAIPVIGGITNIIVAPGFAAASTWALGRVFIIHFESGGTILDFDPAKVREHYQELFNSKRGM